jgi:hypothetical protein
MCSFCKGEFYIKTIRCTKPLLAPVTRAEELRQELLNITGEEFMKILNEIRNPEPVISEENTSAENEQSEENSEEEN